MRRRILSFTSFFFALLTMLAVSGCAGKTVRPPFKPSAETTARPEATPRTPSKQTAHEQARPERSQPGQTPGELPLSVNEDGEKPVEPAKPPPPLQPKLGPAASLYNQGERYLKEGKLNKAEMCLKRALRIEPRNPYYWHAMAEIRLRQGKKREAVQCCLKSNSLAFGNSQLIRWNNAMINGVQTDGAANADFL